MKRLAMAALAAVFLTCATAAFAADVAPNLVVVPWGDLVAAILPAAEVLFMGALLWVASTFAPPLYAFLRTKQVEQLLNRAGDFAFNSVGGAVKGRELSIEVGNAVLREMLDYALKHGGAWLTEFAGTPIEIAEKAYARLPFPAEATKPDFAAIVNDVTAAPK